MVSLLGARNATSVEPKPCQSNVALVDRLHQPSNNRWRARLAGRHRREIAIPGVGPLVAAGPAVAALAGAGAAGATGGLVGRTHRSIWAVSHPEPGAASRGAGLAFHDF